MESRNIKTKQMIKKILLCLFLIMSYLSLEAQCTTERISNSTLIGSSGSYTGWSLSDTNVFTNSSGRGVSFRIDGQTNNLTQNITNVNPQGNTSPIIKMNIGAYDALAVANSKSASLTVYYNGVQYMSIETRNGITTGGAYVYYYNGASGNYSRIPMVPTGDPAVANVNIELTLPNNTPNSGQLRFYYDGSGTAPVDDFYIGSVSLITTLVTPTPTISAGATSFCVGGSVTLTSSSASGNQWYKDGVIISGVTGQTYSANTSGTYTVIVTTMGCASPVSAGTTVTVNSPPPALAVSAGGPTTFCTGGSVLLTSTYNTTGAYQWYFNGTAIPGAVFYQYTANASGTYTVTRELSGCTSPVSAGTTVTVNPTPATPSISAGGPTTFCTGGSVILTSSSASGNQWYRNGTIISGATAQTYAANTSGTYTVTVTTSGCPSAASAGTVVTVNSTPATPTISAGGSTTFCAGGSVTLTSSSASGNQWYRNGILISGATGQTYSANTSGTYTVIVTASSCPSAASAGTAVTVNNCTGIACNTKFYLTQYPVSGPTTLYELDNTTNPFTITSIGTSPANMHVNAIGYNTVDNLIYGIRTDAGFMNYMVRIDGNGVFTSLGAVTNLPTGGYNSGAFDNGGNYYVLNSGSTRFYRIDVTTNTATLITLSRSLNVNDIVYDKTTGKIFGYEGVSGANILVSIDPVTGTVTNIGASGLPDGTLVGALYVDASGDIFGNVDNGSGFYQFNKTTGTAVKISNSIGANGNDGTNCPDALITFPADLSITKTDGKTVYTPGTTNTYTIVVSNNSGQYGVLGATVSDPVPAGIPAANVSYSVPVLTGGATTSITGTQTGALNDVVGLPIGATITYTVAINVPVAFTGDLTNTVTVTPPVNSTDPNNANNSATDIDSFNNPCAITASNPDSDGDGIANSCDLDDDNDGILDTNECSSPDVFANYSTSTITGASTSNATVSNIKFGGVTGTLSRVNVGVSAITPIYINSRNLSNGSIYTPAGTTNQSTLTEELQNFNNLVNNVTTYTLNLDKPVESITLHVWDFDFMRTRFTGNHKEQLVSGGPDLTYDTATRVLYDIDIATYSNVIKDGFGSVKITSTNGLPFTQVVFQKFDDPISSFPGDTFSYTFSAVSACDTDGDGIPNRLDLDSDNDGCLDAIEGSAAITSSQLVNAGGTVIVGTGSTASNQNICTGPGCIDPNGIPVIVGVSGQGVGHSQNSSLNDCTDFMWPTCIFDNTNGGNATSVSVAKSNVTPSAAPTITYLQNASASASGMNELDFGGIDLTNTTGNRIPNVLVDISKIGFWTQNITGTIFKLYNYNETDQVWEGTLGNGQKAYFKLLGVSVNGTAIANPNIKLLPIQNSASVTGYHLASTGNTVSDAATSFTDGGTGSNYSITGATVSLPANLPVIDLGALANGASLTNVKIRMGLVMPNNADAWVASSDSGVGDIDYYVYGFADVWGTGYDFGDAPSGYGIAQHAPGLCKPAIYIGPNRQDYESSITGSITADADDLNMNNYDDENNGLPNYSNGQNIYTVTLPYVNNSSAGIVSAWIDWDNNGIFDTSERANTTVSTGSGNATLIWRTSGAVSGEGTIPQNMIEGNKIVRTRIGTVSAEILSPSGIATDGEVEDRLLFVSGYCYESPTDVTAIVPVNHGISALGRAGAENGNWPMLRNSAYTALEAKTKGFVVTRTTSPETTVAIPVVGMMVFDTDEDGGKGCLKIYTGSGVGEGWKCFTTQGCPPPPSN